MNMRSTMLSVIALSCLWAGCATPVPGHSPIAEVMGVLDAVEAATEAGDVDRAMTFVSKSYGDSRGWTSSDVRSNMEQNLTHFRDIRIERKDLAYVYDSSREQMAVKQEFTTTAEPLKKSDVNLDRVTGTSKCVVYLKNEEGAWKVVAWEDVSQAHEEQ